MNREERRRLERSKKKAQSKQVVQEELNDNGKEFIEFADENKVDLNAFFKMFSYWLHLSTAQKEAVIVECIKQGKINMEDKKNAEQGSESK